MRLLWLPQVLRAAGLTVHEVSGWRTRGSDSWGPVVGITCHETRGSRTSTDAGEIGVLIRGSNTAPPPISQLYLSRTGAWHVVASGRCNHNLTGWAGPNKGLGNSRLLGIEAQHALGEPWTDRQYDSYVRGVAALVAHKASGWDVGLSRVAGHKEHQPAGYGQSSTKTDPSFNMVSFRSAVTARLAGEDDDMQQPEFNSLMTGYADFIANGDTPAHDRIRRNWAAVTGSQPAGDVDEAAIVAGVLAGLTPAKIAAAIPDAVAQDVVDALGRRLAGQG